MSSDPILISSEPSAIDVNAQYFGDKVFSTVFQPAKCHAIDDTQLHTWVDLQRPDAGKLFEEHPLQVRSIGWYSKYSFLITLRQNKNDTLI